MLTAIKNITLITAVHPLLWVRIFNPKSDPKIIFKKGQQDNVYLAAGQLAQRENVHLVKMSSADLAFDSTVQQEFFMQRFILQNVQH